jgi:hypothetical protein
VRWVRTFPLDIPPGRSYVVDDLPRMLMSGYNYVPAFKRLDGDTVIAEWDIAFTAEDRDRFTAACEAEPGRVHVAPYRLYPVSTGLPEPVWAHRAAGRLPAWISEDDEACDLFSFGLVYLPAEIVCRYLATMPETTGDAIFSQWHREQIGVRVPVHWDVRPIHLHY